MESKALPSLPTKPGKGSIHCLEPFEKLAENLYNLTRTYGDIYSMELAPGHEVVVVNGYENIRELLLTRGADFCSRPAEANNLRPHDPTAPGLSEAPWSDHLAAQRQAVMETIDEYGFNKKNASAVLQEHAADVAKYLDSLNGSSWSPSEVFYVAVASTITHQILGKPFSIDHPPFAKVMESFDSLLEFLVAEIELLGMKESEMSFLQRRRYNKGKGYLSDITNFFAKQVADHKQVLQEEHPRDFIDKFLIKISEEKENPLYNEKQLVQILVDLFMVGTNYMGTALSWHGLYLANRPDVQQKVRGEVRGQCGAGVVTLADKDKLPYTQASKVEPNKAVVLEALRCSCVAAITLPHTTVNQTEGAVFQIGRAHV